MELCGVIQGLKDAKDTLKFISLTQDLETIGMLTTEVNTYPFKFMNVQKQFETYRGFCKNVKYLFSAFFRISVGVIMGLVFFAFLSENLYRHIEKT